METILEFRQRHTRNRYQRILSSQHRVLANFTVPLCFATHYVLLGGFVVASTLGFRKGFARSLGSLNEAVSRSFDPHLSLSITTIRPARQAEFFHEFRGLPGTEQVSAKVRITFTVIRWQCRI